MSKQILKSIEKQGNNYRLTFRVGPESDAVYIYTAEELKRMSNIIKMSLVQSRKENKVVDEVVSDAPSLEDEYSLLKQLSEANALSLRGLEELIETKTASVLQMAARAETEALKAKGFVLATTKTLQAQNVAFRHETDTRLDGIEDRLNGLVVMKQQDLDIIFDRIEKLEKKHIGFWKRTWRKIKRLFRRG